MEKQIKVITKDDIVHDVWKYIMSGDGEANVWCHTWEGRHVIGNDCEFYNSALSKAEAIKPVEDVAYMLDNMDKFQLEDTDYDYSNVNDEISKAEEPTLAQNHIQPPRTNELRYDAAISDNATEAKQDLLNQEGINGAASLMFSKADYKARCLTCGQEHLNWSGSTPCCGSLSELIEPLQALAKAEDKGDIQDCSLRINGKTMAETLAPQPTNSLDELERWVKKNYVNYNYEERLLAKIQELKTITT